MKVAVTATGASLDAPLDPRLGRCSYFVFVETDDMRFETIENPNLMLGGGAGIQSAQLIAEKGAKFVLTGNCGPNAHQTLSAAGVSVIVGCSGSVLDVVERFKAGQLRATGSPNVTSHFGTARGEGPVPPSQPARSQAANNERIQMMTSGVGGGGGWEKGYGMGRGMGRGRRGGQGMGRGMGRGWDGGRGMGRGRGGPPDPNDPSSRSGAGPLPDVSARPSTENLEREVQMLEAQADAMIAQLQAINARISEIQGKRKRVPTELRDQEACGKTSSGMRSLRMTAVIDEQKCTSCGICVDSCPDGAITLNGMAMVEPQKCTGCGTCVDECPDEAISLVEVKPRENAHPIAP